MMMNLEFMTEEAGDDDFSDVGSMGTPASTQLHHQNYYRRRSVCVCVFVGRCPEGEESNVCELVVVERKYSKSRMLMSTSRVGGQIGFALGNGT